MTLYYVSLMIKNILTMYLKPKNKMRYVLVLWLFFVFASEIAFSQKSEREINSDSLEMVSPPSKKNFFKSAIDYFMGTWDTLYVTPNKYDFAFLTTYYNNNEIYNIHSSYPENQTLRLMHKPQNKIGFYFGWQFLYLGWSFGIDRLFDKPDNTKNGSSFELSLYSSKFGIDLVHIKTGNNFLIRKVKGIEEPEYITEKNIYFDGFEADVKGANIYYILNNKRFSYPAAFSQTTVQRRNSGSGIVGLLVSSHNIRFDHSRLPALIQENLNMNMKFNQIKYTNISLSFGYGYNWVFARNLLACISASPVLAYKATKKFDTGEDVTGFFRHFNIDLLVRAGVVYNNGKYYIGSSFLGRSYGFNQKKFSLNNGYSTLQIYAGFNFHLKKQYKDQL